MHAMRYNHLVVPRGGRMGGNGRRMRRGVVVLASRLGCTQGLVLISMILSLNIVTVTANSSSLSTTPAPVAEYCWQAFNATCPADHMILMQHAHYGRMKLGRCLPRNYDVGCYADVITYMDHKCSGRHHCEMYIPDSELQLIQPCKKDLMTYLEATYQCMPVSTGGSSACRSRPVVTLRAPSGYLASIVTARTGVGSSSCPWVIQVSPGQRINLTLLDFNIGSATTSTERKTPTSPTSKGKSSPNNGAGSGVNGAGGGGWRRIQTSCQMYAVISERGKKEVNICGANAREKLIYTSSSNVVQVKLMAITAPDTPVENHGYFAIRYEADGCADLAAPAHGTAVRNGDKLTISCNSTGDVRHLVCSGTRWIGEIKNCSADGATNLAQSADTDKAFPYGLVVAIVIGVVLGIALGVVLLTVVMICQRRLHQKKRTKNGVFFSGSSQTSVSRMDCVSKHVARAACIDNTALTGVGGIGTGVVRTGQYGYAHVWELQQLKASNSSPDVIDTEHRDSSSGTGQLCGDPLVIYERNPNIITTTAAGGTTGAAGARVMHGPRTKDCPAYESSLQSLGGGMGVGAIDDAAYYDYDPDQGSVMHVINAAACQHNQQQQQQCADCCRAQDASAASAHVDSNQQQPQPPQRTT